MPNKAHLAAAGAITQRLIALCAGKESTILGGLKLFWVKTHKISDAFE